MSSTVSKKKFEWAADHNLYSAVLIPKIWIIGQTREKTDCGGQRQGCYFG